MHRCVSLFVVLLALAAPAHAGLPPIPNVTVPAGITLVGSTAGVADASGRFTVTVRDLANLPIPGSIVAVDFLEAPDLQLCPTPGLPGLTVNLVQRTVRGVTDENGVVPFVILGGSHGPALTTRGRVRIFADGVQVTSTSPVDGFVCAALDLDGDGGLSANDISALLGDLGSGGSWQRSDLDLNGLLGANDLSVLLTRIGAAGSTESCP